MLSKPERAQAQKPARMPGGRQVPPNLTAEATDLLRPDTIRALRQMAATRAAAEYPLNLTREEAFAILDLIDTRWTVSRAWARTLEWAIRYARIAQQFAARGGFKAYADWIDRNRIEPMRRIHDELTSGNSMTMQDQTRYPEA